MYREMMDFKVGFFFFLNRLQFFQMIVWYNALSLFTDSVINLTCLFQTRGRGLGLTFIIGNIMSQLDNG